MPDLSPYDRAKILLLKWELLLIRLELNDALHPDVVAVEGPKIHDLTRGGRESVAEFRHRLEESATDEEFEEIELALAEMIQMWPYKEIATLVHSALLF